MLVTIITILLTIGLIAHAIWADKKISKLENFIREQNEYCPYDNFEVRHLRGTTHDDYEVL